MLNANVPMPRIDTDAFTGCSAGLMTIDGSDAREVRELVNARARQLVGADDLHRLRDFLNGLLALRGGDDDFFESIRGFSGLRLRQLHA